MRAAHIRAHYPGDTAPGKCAKPQSNRKSMRSMALTLLRAVTGTSQKHEMRAARARSVTPPPSQSETRHG